MAREALSSPGKRFVEKHPGLNGIIAAKDGGVSLLIVTSGRQLATDFPIAQGLVRDSAPSIQIREERTPTTSETTKIVQVQASSPKEIGVFLRELSVLRNRRNRALEK